MYSGSYKSPETYKAFFPDSTDKTSDIVYMMN